MDAVYPLLFTHLGCYAIKPQTWFARRVVKDFYIPPSYPFPHTETQGLGKGLFSAKPEGKSRVGRRPVVTDPGFFYRKYPLDKPVAPLADYFFNSSNADKVYAGSIDHFKNF